jgi:sarcosine oxidase
VPDQRRCLVVGAGLLGLSAARALAGRHWQVTVFDAAPSAGHGRAGSTGDARIFRYGYPDPLYVEMAARAAELWHRLETDSGRRLLHECGQLTFGDSDALAAIADALGRAGVPVEHLSSADAIRRFPGVAVDGPLVHEPASGVLAADECLRALGDGGDFELRSGITVTAVRPHVGGVRVALSGTDEHVDADVAVVCAGPGSLPLLGTRTVVAAPPSLPQVAYFSGRPGTNAVALPICIEWGPAMLYGLPVLGSGPHAGTYKVSHHTPGPALGRYDPADPDPWGTDDPALLHALTDAVRRLLPGLDTTPVATERCVYDNSVDTDFVVDRVGPVVVGCGTSGHAFKFGPLLGEALADLAEDAAPRLDLARFALDREPAGLPGGHP